MRSPALAAQRSANAESGLGPTPCGALAEPTVQPAPPCPSLNEPAIDCAGSAQPTTAAANRADVSAPAHFRESGNMNAPWRKWFLCGVSSSEPVTVLHASSHVS